MIIQNISLAYSLIQRIPYGKLLIFLMLVAGVAEGIGLSALVPVLSTLTGEYSAGQLPMPFNLIPKGLEIIGIKPDFSIMLALALVIMLSAYFLIHLQERAIFYARYRFLEEIRNRANTAIFKSNWEHFLGFSSGKVTNIVIHESNRGAEGLLALMTLLAISIQLIIYGLFAFLLSWEMFLIALATIVLASFTAFRLIKTVRKMGQKSVDIDALYAKQFVEFIRGAKLLKTTGTTHSALAALAESNGLGCATNSRICINQSLMKFELQAIVGTAMVVILFVAIEWLEVKVSVLLVFMFILIRLAPKFSTLQGQLFNFSAYLPALETLDVLIRDSEKSVENFKKETYTFDDIEKHIKFENVTFQYKDAGTYALKNISFTVEAKGFVALVGKSGSGKSTALDLLTGLIEPTEGRILIDGFNIKKINKSNFRNSIGLVSQDSTFFIGTIRDNICFGLDQKCKDELIWNCLDVAQIDEFVSKLPNGLDTQVGESGLKLSGGQRQRLAIARALVRQPTLLILDEATSALDSESEALFQKAIQKIAKNYTIVVVAHRLSTISKAQKIIVLNEGELVEEGNYHKLVERDGPFSKLVKAQAIDLDTTAIIN
jgi:ABC-type multidrug transport system fused ATPase/permease subunit